MSETFDLFKENRFTAEFIEKELKKFSSPPRWCLEELGIDLFDNQIEIINEVVDLDSEFLAILQARGAGKTFAVGLGLIRLCLFIPGLKIGIFGPKTEQANRIIKELRKDVLKPGTALYSEVDWLDSTNSRMTFKNGSQMLAISAAETSMQEGYHFHLIVLDECHRIADASVNQRLMPMIGSLGIAKVIKIGISMYKQNFWKSCHDSKYKVLKRDWSECPILLQKSFVYRGVNKDLDGKEISKTVLNMMPLTMKQKLFPDRPDLHFDGELTEFDFKTNYSMEWVSDVNLELSGKDQETLFSGDYEILKKEIEKYQEKYFWGLDTAPGTLGENKKDLDFTALAIWRLIAGGMKEKVACFEWQGDSNEVIDEIEQIVNPQDGLFKCMFGLVDYSNIAYNLVSTFKKKKIPIEGIIFGAREKHTGKNFKNAMFDQFHFELIHNRVKYPNLDRLDRDKAMKKAFNEWCVLERHLKLGVNAKISAPSGLHDDHPCADALAIWAIDHAKDFVSISILEGGLRDPISGVQPLFGRGVQIYNPNKNRYLR